MMKSVGFIELNSIARGVETADFMIKAAAVRLIFAKPVCPGKYIILVEGDVDAVKASTEVGKEAGGPFIVDSFVLSNVHPQVIYALNAVTEPKEKGAVGIVEYFSVSESIIGADVACKAAQVDIIEIRLGFAIGGKSFFVVTGSVSSVESAVNATINSGSERGDMIVGYSVIPSPADELYYQLL